MDAPTPPPAKHATAWGVVCGAGSALCWSLGFVAARQGINVGLSPLVIALHRYVWPGLALLPFVVANGFRDLGGAAVLTDAKGACDRGWRSNWRTLGGGCNIKSLTAETGKDVVEALLRFLGHKFQ